MTLSLFLAKLFGVYMLIAATIWATRKKELEGIIKELIASKALLFYSSLFDLLMGLAIVIGHPIWEANWRGLITLIGYLLTFRGIIRFAFTAQVQKFATGFIRYGYWIAFTVWLLLGLCFVYHGFEL
ncbi:MAG: hypothetical protein P4L16_07335 [Chlamydiales bacterium]|nr:hypothetical protein [Chlamydiales bacterium]